MKDDDHAECCSKCVFSLIERKSAPDTGNANEDDLFDVGLEDSIGKPDHRRRSDRQGQQMSRGGRPGANGTVSTLYYFSLMSSLHINSGH